VVVAVEDANVYVIRDQVRMIIVGTVLGLIAVGVPEISFCIQVFCLLIQSYNHLVMVWEIL
jgi:hypothetical protein